ncbi:unnamed protein product [Somion occarium]|uniref:Uncharacterized protein n=1 Tax=Somion occarium TaxID=3059160 RepID=A0ABP1E3E7_9APHY
MKTRDVSQRGINKCKAQASILQLDSTNFSWMHYLPPRYAPSIPLWDCFPFKSRVNRSQLGKSLWIPHTWSMSNTMETSCRISEIRLS